MQMHGKFKDFKTITTFSLGHYILKEEYDLRPDKWLERFLN
jgi:hypothetical protein